MSDKQVVDTPEHLALDYVKDKHITEVLASVDGNRTKAAKILRVDRRTLYRWLKEHS